MVDQLIFSCSSMQWNHHFRGNFDLSPKHKSNIFNHNAAFEHIVWGGSLWKNMFLTFLKLLKFYGRYKCEFSWAYAHYFSVDFRTKIFSFLFLRHLVSSVYKFWCNNSFFCLRNLSWEIYAKIYDIFLVYFKFEFVSTQNLCPKNLFKILSLLFPSII